MSALRILLNAVIIAAEMAAVAAVAWAGYREPALFSAATAVLAFLLGLSLEAKRLRNELPFYFGAGRKSFILVPFVGATEALLKGVLAGLAALLTFSGTDADRLFWVAIAFGLVVYAGAALLRAMSIRLDGLPARWGFFRLGPLLGLMFSAAIAALTAYGLMKSPSVSDIGWRIVWELPANPSLAQVSELFFQLKQAFDEFVVALLGTVMSPGAARVAGIVASVNVLAGFVAAVYAALIASAVRWAEDHLP